MRLVAVLAASLLAASLFSVQPVQAQNSPGYPLPIAPATWSRPRLNVVLYPNSTLNWYSPTLLASASKAIRLWNDAFSQFADLYPRYSYLGQLYFAIYVAGSNGSSVAPDISVRFESISLPNAAAYTHQCWYVPSNQTCAETIYLGPHASQPGITHEFGLALGLSEPPTALPYDLMMHVVAVSYPSTLDLYALAFKYQWLQSGSYHYSDPGPCGCVYLPSSIPYQELVPYQVQLAADQAQLIYYVHALVLLQSQYGSLSAGYSSLRANYTALAARASALMSNLTSLQSSVSILRQQLTASGQNDTALASELSAESMAISSMRSQVAALRSSLDQASSQAQKISYWQALSVVLVAALATTFVYSRRRTKSVPG